MPKKILVCVLFFLSLAGSVTAFALEIDLLRFPMILLCALLMSLWLFRPKEDAGLEGKAVFYALIAYGLVSIVLSLFLYSVAPLYGMAWGFEYNPNDAGGVVFPIVNDAHENCLLTTVVFLLYFAIAGFQRLRLRLARPRG